MERASVLRPLLIEGNEDEFLPIRQMLVETRDGEFQIRCAGGRGLVSLVSDFLDASDLVISKMILAAHGGRIWVESKESKEPGSLSRGPQNRKV